MRIRGGWVCLAVVLGLGSSAGATDEAPRLPHPFTAEQIREEWVEGLTLVLQRTSPAGETRERWTVVASDDAGATIELAPIDAEGRVVGPGERKHSSWEELRDHASFPADSATRTEVTRETPLGTLDGWLYVVSDAAQGTVTEYFFARDLPGAPVELKVTQAGQTLMEMKQVSRSKR